MNLTAVAITGIICATLIIITAISKKSGHGSRTESEAEDE